METSSRTLSARAPSIPRGLRSTKTRWLSVPPDRRIKHKPVHIWCEQRKWSSKSICITNCISLASNNSQKSQAFYQTPGCSLSSARLVPLTWHSASPERCTVWTWEWKPAGTDISHQGCCKWKDWLLCVLWSVLNIKKNSRPVWVQRPLRRWHGYEVHPEVRGKRQSSPCPAGYRALPSLSYPQIAPLSCRRSDRLCKLKRKPILLLPVKTLCPYMRTPQFALVNIKTRCSPGATQGLMGRGRDQVSVLKRGGNSSCCNQATDMCHVCQQVGVQFNTKLKHTNVWFLYPQHSVKYFLLM